MRDRSRLMLTTERLRFETWLLEDQPLLDALHADPRMQANYAPGPDKWTPAGIARRFAGYMSEQESEGFTKWKLSLLDGTFIGRAGWSRWEAETIEIGYALEPSHWNKGYASEAARALIAWALAERPRETLAGFALTRNAASRRILAKVGMHFIDRRMIGRSEHAYYELPHSAVPSRANDIDGAAD